MIKTPHIFLIVSVLAMALCPPAWADTITVHNESGHKAKVAAPGAKSVRVPAGGEAVMTIEPTTPNGVDAKAWWNDNPRQLCVIFVRYGGVLKITGNSAIHCLGN